jgi:hypothetical protein
MKLTLHELGREQRIIGYYVHHINHPGFINFDIHLSSLPRYIIVLSTRTTSLFPVIIPFDVTRFGGDKVGAGGFSGTRRRDELALCV